MQADTEFVTLLAAIRVGTCSRAQLDGLQRRCGHELDVSDGILPTQVGTARSCPPLCERVAPLPRIWVYTMAVHLRSRLIMTPLQPFESR